MFGGWPYLTNLDYHYNGRVFLTWRPNYYHIRQLIGTTQSITCLVTDSTTQIEFQQTAAYAINTKEERREL